MLYYFFSGSNWSHLGWWLIIQAEKRNKRNNEMDFHFPTPRAWLNLCSALDGAFCFQSTIEAKWHLRLRVKRNFPLNDALLLQSVDSSWTMTHNSSQKQNKTKQIKTKQRMNEWIKGTFPYFDSTGAWYYVRLWRAQGQGKFPALWRIQFGWTYLRLWILHFAFIRCSKVHKVTSNSFAADLGNKQSWSYGLFWRHKSWVYS